MTKPDHHAEIPLSRVVDATQHDGVTTRPHRLLDSIVNWTFVCVFFATGIALAVGIPLGTVYLVVRAIF